MSDDAPDISKYAHHAPTESKAQSTSAPDPSLDMPSPARKAMYHIVHRESGRVVGKASTRKGARQSLDRNDNAYGGYAHKIVEVGGNSERS